MEIKAIPAKGTGESGFGFVETMIAALIMFVGLTAVLGLFAVSMTHEHEQGSVNSRATTYCQTKMEELLALNFADTTTNTTVWPPNATGKGLGGNTAGSTYGSVDPAAPLADYTDYLRFDGTRVPSTDANIFFTRQWHIAVDATGNLKTITVRTTAKRKLSAGTAPFVTLVSMKFQVT